MISLMAKTRVNADGRLRTARLAMALAACAVFGVGPPARAGMARAQFAVGVTVMARTLLISDSSPRQLQVSAADVARGYVEVPGATRLSITNTNQRGYVVNVWPQTQVFSAVIVKSGDAQAELGIDGGQIFEARTTGQMLSLALDFRFVLAAGVKPGVYPWPVRLQVSSPPF